MIFRHLKRAYLILSLLLIAALLVLVPQADSLGKSFEAIKSADLDLIAFALLLVFATYLAAAFTLISVALKPLAFKRTLIVQLASGFATKLVPAGIGGIALNMRYLLKHQHTGLQAGSVMALNSLLGFAGHVSIIILSLILSSHTLSEIWVALPEWVGNALLALLFVFSLIFIAWVKARLVVIKLLFNTLNVLRTYFLKPAKLLYGFLGASAVTLLFASCLFLCALSLGIYLSPLEVLWTLTIGLFGASITPTPGGIGGAEAALTGGLMATGLSFDEALPVALTYRLISYWLPILPGFLFFRLSLKRKFI